MDLIGCEDYEGNYFVVKEASVDQLKGCFFFFFFFFCKVVGSGTRGDHHAQGQIRRSNPAS
jgi:hypothetical protein